MSILDDMLVIVDDLRDLTANIKRMEIEENLDEMERLIGRLRKVMCCE